MNLSCVIAVMSPAPGLRVEVQNVATGYQTFLLRTTTVRTSVPVEHGRSMVWETARLASASTPTLDCALGAPELHANAVEERDRLLVDVDPRSLVHALQLLGIVGLESHEDHVQPCFGPPGVELLVAHDVVSSALHPEATSVAALDQRVRQ